MTTNPNDDTHVVELTPQTTADERDAAFNELIGLIKAQAPPDAEALLTNALVILRSFFDDCNHAVRSLERIADAVETLHRRSDTVAVWDAKR